MKGLFSIAAFIFILFISQTTVTSCSKTVTNYDTVVNYIPYGNTIEGKLTGKQWIVDSLFYDYTPGTQGTRVYTRGASGNVYNLDNAVVIFLNDGSQLSTISGSSYASYPYIFRDADSMNIRINNPNPDYARIVRLETNYLTIYDSTNSGISYYSLKP